MIEIPQKGTREAAESCTATHREWVPPNRVSNRNEQRSTRRIRSRVRFTQPQASPEQQSGRDATGNTNRIASGQAEICLCEDRVSAPTPRAGAAGLAIRRGRASFQKSIRRKIDVTQNDIRDSVAAISRISHTIEQINNFQNSIAGAVEEQTVVTRDISRNVADAARGTSEIAGNITLVARAAEGTAAGANATRAAAQDATRLANQLNELVSQFRSE